MRKPAIPAVTVPDQQIAALLRPMKENIESLTGIRGGAITPLPGDAALGSVISKLNEVIARMNA